MRTDFASLVKIGKALSGVTEDIKWGDDLCLSVGGKMFFVIGLGHETVTASCKVPEENFRDYIEIAGIIPAPYLAKYHWILVQDINLWSPAGWKPVILRSYELVRNKLPRKIKDSLG